VIPRTILVVASGFAPSLSGAGVASAIARGIAATARALETELYALDDPRVVAVVASEVRGRRRVAERGGFVARLSRARAVVLARPHLFPDALGPGPVFEIATRARQGGVPAYAITASSTLDLFQARMLDLQVVLEARSERALLKAGRELGALI
jgi:hypothetical protein